MIAVVPVRGGELAGGGEECAAEAGGVVLLIGEGVESAGSALAGVAHEVHLHEAGAFAPASWAARLAPLVAVHEVVLLPASPDGRDLAPRLADRLGRPLVAGAIAAWPGGAEVVRHGGRTLELVAVDGPFVATLQPGVRGVERRVDRGGIRTEVIAGATGDAGGATGDAGGASDAEVLAVLPADPATIDLAEADRITGAGAGLGSAEACELLRRVGLALGAATGGTRVVTDWGWLPLDRQIGTTGVAVDPDLYLAFGVSGAVQHVAGLGRPGHVVSVNVDPACPMSSLADLAVVADAPATLRALARLLEVES